MGNIILDGHTLLCVTISPMKLSDYLKETGETDKAFSERAECSRGYITQLRLGIRKRPSLSKALNIARATAGKVPVEVWG